MDNRPLRTCRLAAAAAATVLLAAGAPPAAAAGDGAWEPMFSCRASNGKEIRVDASGTTLQYRFGNDTAGAPEITLYAPVAAFAPLPRGGQVRFDSVDGYSYTVVANYPGANMSGFFGVVVTRYEKPVVSIPCATGVAVNGLTAPDMAALGR